MTSPTTKNATSLAFVFVALLAVLALAGCGSDSTAPASSAPPDYEKALAGAPPALAELYADGNELLPGGREAFTERIESLGHPAVVNKWASWCGPCREEFPYLQELAAELGTEIAFLGVNANDNDDAAATFLRDNPLPYPSYLDPDEDISSAELEAPIAFPATAFYDASGKLIATHQGVYTGVEDLRADIEENFGLSTRRSGSN